MSPALPCAGSILTSTETVYGAAPASFGITVSQVVATPLRSQSRACKHLLCQVRHQWGAGRWSSGHKLPFEVVESITACLTCVEVSAQVRVDPIAVVLWVIRQATTRAKRSKRLRRCRGRARRLRWRTRWRRRGQWILRRRWGARAYGGLLGVGGGGACGGGGGDGIGEVGSQGVLDHVNLVFHE